MSRRLSLLVAFIILSLLLSGCNGARETDSVAYVLGIGVDITPDQQYSTTYLIAIPRAMSGAEKGDSKKLVEKITITATSVAEAHDLLTSVISRTPNLSHAKWWVISEELARKGVANIIGPLTRYREHRGSMYLLVVRDATAKEFIRQNDPVLELLPSRWSESLLAIGPESVFSLPSQLHNFYVRLKDASGSPYTALAGINPKDDANRQTTKPETFQWSSGYLPGDIAREGGNPVTIMGTALFKGDKMVGMLTNTETRMVSILLNNVPEGYLTITDPHSPDNHIQLLVELGRPPKITVNLTDGLPIINIETLLEAELVSIPSGINYESDELRKELEQHISKIICLQIENMLAKTQQLETDIINFGKYLRPAAKNYTEFNELNWNSLYPQAKISVKVDTKVRRTGLMFKTMPIRK